MVRSRAACGRDALQVILAIDIVVIVGNDLPVVVGVPAAIERQSHRTIERNEIVVVGQEEADPLILEEAVVDDVAYEMLVLLFPESAMAGFDFRYTLPEFRIHVVLVAHVYAPIRMRHEKAPTGP